MADTIWQWKVQKKLKFCLKLVFGGFRSCLWFWYLRLSKFKMAVKSVRGRLRFWLKLVFRGLRGRRLKFSYWTFEIQNGGTNMAVANSKKFLIGLKIGIQRLSWSLITILLSAFEIQSDGQKIEGSILLKICVQGFSRCMIKILLLLITICLITIFYWKAAVLVYGTIKI